jgi:hypothetical protein
MREHRVLVFDLSKPLPIRAPEEMTGFEIGDGWLVPGSWSPDGSLMAGQIVGGAGPGALAVYDPRLGKARQVSEDRNGGHWLDSHRLVALTTRNEIAIIDALTGQRHVLSTPQLADMPMNSLVPSPDGRTLFFGVRRTEADIWMAMLR